MLPAAAVLAAAALALASGATLPASLAGLRDWGAYATLAAAAALAFAYNRGRALVTAVSALLAYAAVQAASATGDFALRAVHALAAILVPANAIAALALAERGVRHHRDYRWLLGLAAEALAVLWIAAAGRSALSGGFWRDLFEHPLLRTPPAPWLARAAILALLALVVARGWKRPAPLEWGVGGAALAFLLACEAGPGSAGFGLYAAAAGVILAVALLQESHRLAFRDELTGLPGRRALEEALAALGPRYAIAMVDVDHFKRFNDTHGHEVGDQVLRLVAARLAQAGGGARAYRYGGEEFALLFPEATVAQALPHLEVLREAIERYPLAVRAADRPRDREAGLRRRGRGEPCPKLSVTVSIGVAASGRGRRPHEVLRAADEALYRAKRAGRNRVSR